MSEIDTETTTVLPSAELQVGEIVTDAPVVIEETRKGYKTTEFWILVLGSLGTVTNLVPVPDSKEGYLIFGLAAAYVIARGIAKKGVGNVTPVAPLD